MQGRLRRLRRHGQLQPGRDARVGAQDAQPADVGQDAHAVAARQGLGCQQQRRVEQLFQRVAAGHAGLTEQGVDSHVRPRPRGRVRHVPPLRHGRGAPPFDGEDWRARPHATGDAGETTRVAERFEVEQDDTGRGIVLPALKQIVGGDIGFGAERDERGDAQAEPAGVLQEGEAEHARLRGDGHRAARRQRRGERRVERSACSVHVGDEHAHAVGTDQAHAALAAQAQQRVLAAASLVADLGEAGGHDDEAAHARVEAGPRRLQDGRGRHGDDGQVDRLGDGGDGWVGAHGGDGRRRGVDRVDGAGEAAGQEMAEQHMARRAGPARRADDSDRARAEDRLQRGGRGHMQARVGARPVGGIGRQRDLDLDHPAVEPTASAESESREQAEHAPIGGQDLGQQRADAGAPRVLRQALEQDGPDTMSVCGVVDRDSHLGARWVAQRIVGGQRHDAPVALHDEGVPRGHDVERPVVDADAPRMEAQRAALGGEPREQRGDPRAVRGTQRPDQDLAAIAHQREGTGH